MASKIKVDQILGSTGSTITVPTGQTLTLTDGLAVASLPTVTVAKGGTNLTSFAAGDTLYATGSTTLAKLTKGSAADVLTMNSGATAPEWAAAAGGGKIGQVLTIQNTDVESTTSTSYATIPDLSISITPAATSSKIWVISSLQLSRLPNHTKYQLFRDTTAIGEGDAAGSRTQASFATFEGGDSNSYACFPNAFTWLDSPSTTSAVAYTWKWITTGGTLYLNRSEDDSDHSNYPRCPSSVTVMEVLA